MVSQEGSASNAAKASIEMLGQILTDSIDLALAVKHAHWNVKGPRFIMIHEMLDGFRGDIDAHVDEIAERLVQLSGTALGTAQVVARHSRLDAYPIENLTEDGHLLALVDRFGEIAQATEIAITQLSAIDDSVSADLVTDYAKVLAKTLWMLQSHLTRS